MEFLKYKSFRFQVRCMLKRKICKKAWGNEIEDNETFSKRTELFLDSLIKRYNYGKTNRNIQSCFTIKH